MSTAWLHLTIAADLALSACIASCISLAFKIVLQNNQGDSLYYGLSVLVAVYVETCLGLACTCMPATAKVFRQHLPALDFIKSALSKPFTSLGSTRGSGGEKYRGGFLGSRRRNFARTESSDGINTKEGASMDNGTWRGFDDARNLEMGKYKGGMQTSVATGPPTPPKEKPTGKRVRPEDGIRLQHEVQQTWQRADRM